MFFLSIVFIIISSFFITCALKEKENNFIYFLLIAFAQIVLTFEILSLLNSISANNFILCNLFILIISLIIFIKTGRNFIKSNIKNEIRKIKNAVSLDKSLMFLSLCFIFFLVCQLISTLFFPVTFGDAVSYYLPRCTAWIQNGNILHYVTPDTRELIMPTNMEFLYTWILLLKKSEFGVSIFSYISFIACIYIIYNLLKELGCSVRKRIWSILVFSSFALIAIEMYTPCADLFIGVLILNSIYLFLKSCKYNNKKMLFFSALSYALAAGTKTTALIAIPATFIALIIIAKKYKTNIIKQILVFSLMFSINFIIFSSYNYILNIIQFSNPISCKEQFLLNQFRGGFLGWISNVIKYSFAIFDISGIRDLINWNGFVTYIQSLVLSIFGITDKTFTSAYFGRYFKFNSELSILSSALGIMGLFAFLPSIIKSIKFSKKNTILFTLTTTLILNILIFSRTMVFTSYNMRYILTFVVIASPIVVYSYIKKTNFLKILMCIFMFTYLVIIPHVIPFQYIYTYIKTKKPPILNEMEVQHLYNFINNNRPQKVALIINQGHAPVYYILKARLNGNIIEQPLLENIEEYNLSQYEYIITNKGSVGSTNVVNFENRMKYPNIYVSKCLYLDYKKNVIEDINTTPAKIQCEIPFEYIERKGFKELEDNNLRNYTIYKKI